ncbi:sulfatase family protein [Conexibacter arvalis]|uniref:Arylsulfatase A-like enzyme n=1 Tax=Conexibacter arvalis TaxID=912552 RepID=A0A840I8Y0_9ACTN|nr:sulfatase [Conexibacter arvalis]MBB4660703.1 arylsulfatase A-like enzyme [Conexibacter arvalis]
MDSRIDRRRFVGIAGGGVVAAAGGAALVRRSRRGGGRPVPDGPNLIVIMLDTLRYDYVGANGNSWIRTPNMDALARESIRFTRAFPEAMPTVPARRSLITSRRVYPWRDWAPTRNLPNTPGWTGLAEHEETWLKLLHGKGYWTGYVTDNPFLGFSEEWAALRRGVDYFKKIGGQVGALRPASSVSMATARRWLPRDMASGNYLKGMRQHLANIGEGRDERKQCAARVFSYALEALDEARRAQRPFALVVDSFDPHEPWVPVKKYRDLYGASDYDGHEPARVRYRPSEYLTEQELDRLPRLYAAAVTQTDAWLGHFLSRFYDSGLADDTAIVLLSDHGMVLGDRGWTGKPALELHPELIQVPFMLRGPGAPRGGTTSRHFASPHDVGPTLMALAGYEPPASARMDGSDLSPLLRGSRPREERPFWFGGYANHWYYRDDRWAMIADGNNSGRELFDLRRDPGETTTIGADNLDVMERIYARVLRRTGLDSLPYFGRDDDA